MTAEHHIREAYILNENVISNHGATKLSCIILDMENAHQAVESDKKINQTKRMVCLPFQKILALFQHSTAH